jgi:hypothetical protein
MDTGRFASDGTDGGELPFVDEHTISITGSREIVWSALERYVLTSLRVGEGTVFAKVLGTRPPAGFEVSERTPTERLTLVGCHRFSRYRLEFNLAEAGDGVTTVRTRTYATFPGVHGRIYRALVIGSGAHVIATRHVLRSIRRSTVGIVGTDQAA